MNSAAEDAPALAFQGEASLMTNRRRGTVARKGKQLYAVVWVNGKRPWLPVPSNITSEERARQYAEYLQEQFDAGNLTIDSVKGLPAKALVQGESVRAWVDRWLAAREARKLRSVKDDRSRMRTHVLPVIGDKLIASITSDDLQALVSTLDERIHGGTLSWKTAKNVWGLVSKAFADARRSKDLSLRVRKDNPALEVSPPDGGAKKQKAYLYPSELAALLACAPMPVRWKRLTVLSIYLYLRAGELEALQCEDIDEVQGIVHIHQAVDRYRNVGEVRETKTGVGRRFTIEPTLMPLLIAMRKEAGKEGPLVKMPPAEDMSERLRQYLRWAGVTRAELFVGPKDRTRKRITWHDLRATGITWRAVRGEGPLAIQRAAGHSDLATTQLYIREAEVVGQGFGEVFAVLPEHVVAGREL